MKLFAGIYSIKYTWKTTGSEFVNLGFRERTCWFKKSLWGGKELNKTSVREVIRIWEVGRYRVWSWKYLLGCGLFHQCGYINLKKCRFDRNLSIVFEVFTIHSIIYLTVCNGVNFVRKPCKGESHFQICCKNRRRFC